jgi:DNA invertase Pin-like site-specific DNA recombinase
MAQHERKAISKRTKEALAAAKAKGTKLGGWRGGPVVDHRLGIAAKRDRARVFNARAADAIAELQAQGITSLREIARRLNDEGVKTSRGGDWQATQVARVLASTQAA